MVTIGGQDFEISFAEALCLCIPVIAVQLPAETPVSFPSCFGVGKKGSI